MVRRPIFFVLLILLCGISDFLTAIDVPHNRPLIVVDDQAYPPFSFLDEKGRAQGITIDIWTAWSKRNHIPIDFRLMPWEDALNAVRNGQADAIGGIFKTPMRAKDFAFTTLGVQVPTSIFFNKRVTGVRSIADLQPFKVGVVAGDISEELMREVGNDIAVFTGVDTMVAAALDGRINVFIADEPVAWYYLLRHPGGGDFRQAETDVGMNLECSAVKLGNDAMLQRIQHGWDSLNHAEIDKIVESWTGHGATTTIPWLLIGGLFSAVVVIISSVLIWNAALRRQVALATADLALRNQHLATANEETLRTHALLQAVIDALPMSIWAVNTTGHVILQNRFSIGTIGDHRGHYLNELPLSPQVLEPWQEAIAPGLRGESATQERWHDLGSGDPRRLEIRIAPVRRDTTIIAVVGAQSDITERYRSDELHHRTRKMIALGQLAGGVAHDFNNMLTGILGFADLISIRVVDDKAKIYAAQISASVSQAQTLTSRLLSFARNGAASHDIYDAHAAITTALDLFSATKHHDLIVTNELHAEKSYVRGFPALFQNAMLNLCLNARDAMEFGGQLRITSDVCTLDVAAISLLRPYAATPGDFLHIAVSDTGLGMEPEVIAYCLEPLFTTKGEQGTGLGLPSVHACVIDHHGALRIESAPRQGTTIHLWLPLVSGICEKTGLACSKNSPAATPFTYENFTESLT